MLGIIIGLIFIALWIGMIIWGVQIGKKKGYSGWVGGLLTFFLSWIGLIIIAVMGPAQPKVEYIPVPVPVKEELSDEEKIEKKLEKLQKMLDDETITKEEYDTLRKRILEKEGE